MLGTGVRNKADSRDRDGATHLDADARARMFSTPHRVGRLTLPGSIGYNETHADGFFFGRGDAAGWGDREGRAKPL